MRRQSGFTLIEIMVAMTLGLIVTAGIVSLVASGSRGNRDLERMARQIENGRYAVTHIGEALRHAGYFGPLFPPAAVGFAAVPTTGLPNACAAPPDLVADMPLHIQGEHNPTGNPVAACLADSDHVDGTDIVTIRRAATPELTSAEVKDAGSTFFLQASATNFVLDTGNNSDPGNNAYGVTHRDLDGDGNPDTAELHAWRVDTYFISPSTRPVSISACDGGSGDGEPVPTLMRARLLNNGWCAEPIAAGIENLQVEYGIDANNDGTPDRYEEQPDNPGEWADTVGVRVYLLARSAETDTQYEDGKAYRMGEGGAGPDGTDTVDASNDGFRRQVFATTVRLENPSARRERP